MDKRTDFENLNSYKYVIVKIKEQDGHYVAYPLIDGDGFFIPDNMPSDELFSNIEYFIDLDLRNKDV